MNLEQMLFNGWESVARTVIVGVLAYVALIAFLRVSGKRTLSKMNAFDLVVTVSLGSTLATVLLSRDVALVEGTVAFALLIALQFAVTWTSVRVAWVRNMVSAEPRLLLCQGKPLTANLGQARVTEDELHAAVRAAGLASLADAGAIASRARADDLAQRERQAAEAQDAAVTAARAVGLLNAANGRDAA